MWILWSLWVTNIPRLVILAPGMNYISVFTKGRLWPFYNPSFFNQIADIIAYLQLRKVHFTKKYRTAMPRNIWKIWFGKSIIITTEADLSMQSCITPIIIWWFRPSASDPASNLTEQNINCSEVKKSKNFFCCNWCTRPERDSMAEWSLRQAWLVHVQIFLVKCFSNAE